MAGILCTINPFVHTHYAQPVPTSPPTQQEYIYTKIVEQEAASLSTGRSSPVVSQRQPGSSSNIIIRRPSSGGNAGRRQVAEDDTTTSLAADAACGRQQ